MLILPIKKKWFDMIRSGEKKEEYREIKQYYDTRFRNAGLIDGYAGLFLFRNGYSNESPTLAVSVLLEIGQGRPEWGAEPGKEYYILHILDYKDITGRVDEWLGKDDPDGGAYYGHICPY